MSTEQNKRVVRQFIENIEQQDYDRLASILAENFTWVVPTRAESLSGLQLRRGKAESLERMKANRVNMRGGMQLKALEWTAEGDRVAVEAEGTIVWNSGKIYNNLYHLAFVVRQGKIETFTEYCDFLYAYETNPLLQNLNKKS